MRNGLNNLNFILPLGLIYPLVALLDLFQVTGELPYLLLLLWKPPLLLHLLPCCVVLVLLHIVAPCVVILLARQSAVVRGSCAYVHLVEQRLLTEVKQEAQSLSSCTLQSGM